MNRAVFLDKDGTLVEDRPPNIDPSRVRFYPDAAAALRLLDRAGYTLVIVSNQGGIAHGRCEESDVRRMLTYVEQRLAVEGIRVTASYFCPHHPEGTIVPYAGACRCRKPQPGLLLQACRDLDLDIHHSWMVGDILDDVEAGRLAGCRTILLNNGHETEWRFSHSRWPNAITHTLLEASELIIASRDQGTSDQGTSGALLPQQEEKR